MSYLFGNVGKDGAFEGEEWDAELRESLQSMPESLLRSIAGEDINANARDGSSSVKPLQEAVDFGDIEELAPEERSSKRAVSSISPISGRNANAGGIDNNAASPDLMLLIAPSSGKKLDVREIFPWFEKNKVLPFSELFAPSQSSLGNNDGKPFHHTNGRKYRPPKPLWNFQEEDLVYASDDEELLTSAFLRRKREEEMKRIRLDLRFAIRDRKVTDKTTSVNSISPIYRRLFEDLERVKGGTGEAVYQRRSLKPDLSESDKLELEEKLDSLSHLLNPSINDWEDQIIWDQHDRGKLMDTCILRGLYANYHDINDELEISRLNDSLLSMWRPVSSLDKLISRTVSKIKNYELEYGDWDERIIWDDENLPQKLPFIHLILNKNDPLFVFDDTVSIQDIIRHAGRPLSEIRSSRRVQKPVHSMFDPSLISNEEYQKSQNFFRNILDRSNLSNDRYYDNSRANKTGRVRHTISQSTVHHSLPALKLVPAFFKCNFTRHDLRNFHRPSIQFQLKKRITTSIPDSSVAPDFSNSHIPKNAKELCLFDGGDYVLLEYSEECPPIIMNSGMGCLINNYYRKKSETDDYVPERDEGAAIVLEEVDASPFFMFGDVKPGQTTTCLLNNLFRAPVFEHDVPSSDFLFIRHSTRKEVRYFIRSIPSIFVVGQTFPLLEVPGIHSRRNNIYLKNRVQFMAWRLLKKSEHPQKAMKIMRLSQTFPQVSDINIRKWVKEFAEATRKGRETGVWALKKGVVVPTEDELRQLVTPEMACLYESMLAGQQLLKDAGYVQVSDDINEDEEDNVDDEVKLAPWIITRNFVNACQRKAMLKLYGPGDPTGRGEGFSFMRASMKEMFFKEGEVPDASAQNNSKFSIDDQQNAYKEEVQRIWEAQRQSLSSKEGIVDAMDLDGVINMPSSSNNNEVSGALGAFESASSSRVQSPAPFKFSSDFGADDDNISVASFGSRASSSFLNTRQKILTIERKIIGSDGTEKRDTEIIRDPRVINAYLRQKQLQEARKKVVGNAGDDASGTLSAPVAVDQLPNPFMKPSEEEDSKKRKFLNLRCSRCGQMGHNKNNRMCPNFRENIVDHDMMILEEKKSISQFQATTTEGSNDNVASPLEVRLVQGTTKLSIPKSALVAAEKQNLKKRAKSIKSASFVIGSAEEITTANVSSSSSITPVSAPRIILKTRAPDTLNVEDDASGLDDHAGGSINITSSGGKSSPAAPTPKLKLSFKRKREDDEKLEK